MIFFDTSAIFALAEPADSNHVLAVRRMRAALDTDEALLVHNYLVVEAATLLQRRVGLDAAVRFLEQTSSYEMHWVEQALHAAAVRSLAGKGERRVSLVDCVSFLVMRAHGVEEAFAFDSDFQREGFRLYAG